MNTKENYAGIFRRGVVYIIDSILFTLCYVLLLLVLLTLSTSLYEGTFRGCWFQPSFWNQGDNSEFLIMISALLHKILVVLMYVLEALMITRLGWTPGQLLFSIRVKDANTLGNVSFMQIVIRNTIIWFFRCLPTYIFLIKIYMFTGYSRFIFAPSPPYILMFAWPFLYISMSGEYSILMFTVFLSILVLIFAVFNQRKQFFYDRIAKTVVVRVK